MRAPSPWIESLNLMPHPEGGFYREIYRSSRSVGIGAPENGKRNLATCIYYLLPSGAFSAFHRLASDELWSHLDGGTVTIHTISPDGVYACHHLGADHRSDATPVVTVPADHWFAAEPAPHTDSLTACFVAPGFDFKDFTMATNDRLSSICPAHSELIERLTLQ